MPIIEKNQLELQEELLEEHYEAERALAERDRAREHELRLAKMKYINQPRHKAWVKIAIAFAKAPAWVLLSISIPVLAARRVEIPQALLDFLSL